MIFNAACSFGNKMCQFCRSSIPLIGPRLSKQGFSSRGISADENDKNLLLFFNNDVQKILKKLTGFDMIKTFAKRNLGEKLQPPVYKFMTSEQIQKAADEAKTKAETLMQMPPVVPIRKEIDVVLAKDPELIGLTESKYIFTDITYGKTDRTRTIVVRDQDGTLRKAYWAERRNANQAYFPTPGRQYTIPKMFQPDYLKRVLDRGDYIFILDRACLEFDADDSEYHRVTQATYSVIEEKRAYGTLRFTRHFGPMVFYLAVNKTIDNLLCEMLKTNRLDEAVELISLYYLIHYPTETKGNKVEVGSDQELDFIKEYINKESKQKVVLELALLELPTNKQTSNEMNA